MKILKGNKLVTVSRKDLTSGKFATNKTGNAPAAPAPAPAPAAAPAASTLPGDKEETPSQYEALTVAKLKDLLDSKGMEYPKTAKKADLVELADSIIEEEDADPAI